MRSLLEFAKTGRRVLDALLSSVRADVAPLTQFVLAVSAVPSS